MKDRSVAPAASVSPLGIALMLQALAAVMAAPAHAYIDPASGSILLQVAAAGVLAAAYTFKRFFYQISGVFRAAWKRIRGGA